MNPRMLAVTLAVFLSAAVPTTACSSSEPSGLGSATTTWATPQPAAPVPGSASESSAPASSAPAAADAAPPRIAFDDAVASNSLHVSGPDSGTVEAAVDALGGDVVESAAVGGEVVYTAVFDDATSLGEVLSLRDALQSTTTGITADLIVRRQAAD